MMEDEGFDLLFALWGKNKGNCSHVRRSLLQPKWTCAHTHPGAFTSPWILPRAKKVSTGHFFYLACGKAALFESLTSTKRKTTPYGVVFFLAEDEGFEPPQTESESGVLPLHKSSICRTFILYPKIPESQEEISQKLDFINKTEKNIPPGGLLDRFLFVIIHVN